MRMPQVRIIAVSLVLLVLVDALPSLQYPYYSIQQLQPRYRKSSSANQPHDSMVQPFIRFRKALSNGFHSWFDEVTPSLAYLYAESRN
uniref:Secreted protein n=1 Tax=Ascaris lumbricoides TaxID=6252 RepID=A0A0M3HUV2_ASCLU